MTFGTVAAPVTWVGGNGGYWDVAANWSPSLPGSSADVALGVFDTEFRSGSVSVQSIAGTGALALSAGNLSFTAASTVGGLRLIGGTFTTAGAAAALATSNFLMSAGTLAGTGSVAVSGLGTWTGGTMTGAGSTSFNGAVALSGNGNGRMLSGGRSVNFNGTTTWTDAGAITANASTINNTGTWLDQTSVDTGIFVQFNAASFNNSGSYTKSGSGTTSVTTAFNNASTGVLAIEAGRRMNLGNGGSLGGTVNVAGAAVLSLSDGTFSMPNLSAAASSGEMLINGPAINGVIVNTSGSGSFGGTLHVTAGSFNVGGTFAAPVLNFSAGSLGGTGAATFSGPSIWTGGTMTGTGSTTFGSSVALSGTDTSRAVSGGRVVNFNGTTTWTNGASASANPGAITANAATINNSGTWLDQTSVDTGIFVQFNAAAFNNSGSYTKSGSGTTSVTTAFNNAATGVLTIETGRRMNLGNGGSLGGTVNVAGAAVLSLSDGTFSMPGLAAAASSGEMLINGPAVNGVIVNTSGSGSFGGTLHVTAGSFNVGGTFAAPVLNFSAGSLGGTGAATFSGPSIWTGGTMTGTGSTTFGSSVALGGTDTSRAVSGGRVVNFNGTTTWTNGASASANPGAITANGSTINNSGTWLDQTSVDTGIFLQFNAASFNNSGIYTKSGSSTTDVSTANFKNTGTIDVRAGVLRLPPSFINLGTVMGAGAVTSTTFTNSGHVAPGDGVGTLTLNGNFVQSTGASFDVELQSAGVHDLFGITGSATLNGALQLICASGCSFAVGQSFKILDAAPNSLVGSFSSVLLTGFAPASFTVTYDRLNGDVLLNVLVATVPEPATAPLILMGVGLLVGAVHRRRRLADHGEGGRQQPMEPGV